MKLVLRTTKTEGAHPLFSRMCIGGTSYWVNLRISVDIKEWNEASQSERKLSNYLNKKGIAKKIALIEDAIADMRMHNCLTIEHLEETIENIVLADRREELKRAEELGKESEKKRTENIKNFLIEYVSRIESGEIRTSNKEKYSKNSIKNWKQFKRLFLDFHKIRPFDWDDINDLLVDRFISFLEGVGYMKFTINKHLDRFRALVSVGERQGLHTNHFAGDLFRNLQIRDEDKAKEIYLTKDELSALYGMPLDGFEEQVRDVFLIGCFTAMRFSDYGRIEKSNIGYTNKGTKVIRILQEKTSVPVVIPITDDRLETILMKYDYNVPQIWGQSLNRAIKRICQELAKSVPSLQKKERTKLTLKERRAEAIAKTKGKVLYEYDEQGHPVKPRWDLVASHTARRSCITNMYLSKKFTIQQMMSISGHKTENMFNKYVKLSLDEYADNVASAACDGLF